MFNKDKIDILGTVINNPDVSVVIDHSDEAQLLQLPEAGEVLDVLPLRNMTLFPDVLLPVAVSRPRSQKLVEEALRKGKLLAVCCQRSQETQDPQGNDLHDLGTCARVVRILNMPDDTFVVILEGLRRIQVEEFVTNKPFIKARVKPLREIVPPKSDKHFLAIVSSVKEIAVKVIKRAEVPSEAGVTLANINKGPSLINYICVNFGFSINEKQELLAYDDVEQRAIRLLKLLSKELEMLEIKADIQEKTRDDINKQQREYYLHQQIETIQKELGDSSEQRVNEMKEKASKKKWSKEVQSIFESELAKLQRLSSHSPDYSTQENYLETMLELPWNEYSEDNFDVKNTQRVLDANHFGMEKVKERIIEFIAVQKQLQTVSQKDEVIKSPIICLYGPPGVGKTSLGKSIAEALGRKYARISLGGLHDESEIRGHRRTYIGAMPGRIIENVKKVQTSNPVFVLDEIDKVGADYKGDPTSALLEVLDPEQNMHFHDNFLNIDYDLSKVFFIATANSLDTIPRPLLDRMELIEMTGYSIEEKIEIAKRHLIPKELEKHGLKVAQLKFNKNVITHIIDDYTRESGVRNLERKIATVCRKVVTRLASEEEYNVTLTPQDVITYLGQPRFSRDEYEGNRYVGVVTGLAWTQVGGEILFIECSLSPSKTPALTLTGNLGDVMKESAQIALGYIKAHLKDFAISQKEMETHSVHIHVPEGAIPKDGPSAGITMTTALVSAYTKRKVRPRIAMTGEMTLRGKVLPIGGVKEKILAAKRAGITDIVLCEENKKDITEIAEVYRKGLTFHYVKDIHEVIDFALL